MFGNGEHNVSGGDLGIDPAGDSVAHNLLQAEVELSR